MKQAYLLASLFLAACTTQPVEQSVKQSGKQLTPPPSAPMAPQLSSAECGVRLGKYLEMGFDQFDQRDEGWREIAKKRGCETAAADLTKQYREWMMSRMDGLIGHEAELRASAGDTANGLGLFRERQAMQDDDPINRLTNEAVIAFLEGDKDRLVAARERLAAVPQPPEFLAAVEAARKSTGRPDLQLTWPLNLSMVDSLVRCFGKPFKVAFVYRCDEAKAAAAETGN